MPGRNKPFAPVTAEMMIRPNVLAEARPVKGIASAARTPFAPGRIILSARSTAGNQLVFNKYRELTRKHFRKFFGTLFTELTGMRFHVAWAQTASSGLAARALIGGRSLPCRLSATPRSKECQTCRSKHLSRALDINGDGYQFTCGRGVRNFWLPIRLRGETLGLANLQTLAQPVSRHPARGDSPLRHHLRRKPDRAIGRVKFTRAVRLLQFLVRHLQISSLADLQQEELACIRQALWVFGSDQKRLRRKLNGLMPAFRQTPPVALLESRPSRIIRTVLERIHYDYARPLTLRKCAGDLRVNAAYLSHLFSRSVGLPFKTCLTQLRIEKARELLSNPARSISEVAGDVGYASENRFRIAFKRATGHSPKVWRETLRMNPQPSSASSQPRS
jgi:AraC-like DNA-binding protein